MILKRCLFILSILINSKAETIAAQNHPFPKRTSYYFSQNGNDKNDGSREHPLKNITALNILHLNNGDSVLLNGHETFQGNLQFTNYTGSSKNFVLTSYGEGSATIDGNNRSALVLNHCRNIQITNIICKGSGRKSGNTKEGILINNCKNISISNIDIAGFQKAGLQLFNCTGTTITNVYAHDNGFAGIGVEGDFNNKRSTRNIFITNCIAENNPGDPSNLTNHSGNGIIVGHSTNVIIDHCIATNNGWDMPRIGNGPVGIWCYESDSVIIESCISYRNKTAVDAADGGGFDLDGGVTNSIIQYCLSYQNQGSGYCMFQYWGASAWHNNIIRFNISIDDGLVSDSRAGVYVWNSSKDAEQFYDCDFYNNTIYNSHQAALSFSETSQRKNFRFFNNIFIADDSLIRGYTTGDIFLANDWWSLTNQFNAEGCRDFNRWIAENKIEKLNGKTVGLNVLPFFKNTGNTTFTDAVNLVNFNALKIADSSVIMQAGIDLHALFNIDPGNKDFNDKPINIKYIGACTNR